MISSLDCRWRKSERAGEFTAPLGYKIVVNVWCGVIFLFLWQNTLMGATERRKWFGLLFRAGVDSLVWQQRQGGRSMGPLVTLFLVRKKRDTCWCHLPFFCSLWILSKTSVHGMGPPVFRVGLPSSVMLLGTTLTNVPGSVSPRWF